MPDSHPELSADRTEPSAASTADNASAQPAKKELPWVVETFLIVLVVLIVVGLFQQFIGRQYVIPSASMEPTFYGCEDCTNDRIFTEKISYYTSEPKPGDVVVFEGTESWNAMYDSPRSDNAVIAGIQDALSFVSLAPPDENTLVKRIIATGGQEVSCQAGDPGIMVDGAPLEEPYVQDPPTYRFEGPGGSDACGGAYFGPITVPEGNYFMMGDNRTNSADSRYHIDDEFQGTIPKENIRGKVAFIIFPFNRIGGVDDPQIQV